MSKIKAEVGMRVFVPKYNYNGRRNGQMKGTIINMKDNYALIKLDTGYKENFYFNDLKYAKE